MRLLFRLFSDAAFSVDDKSDGYIARDIINMNWWNTCGILLGYRGNRRIVGPVPETIKRIAVQLKEFYRVRRLMIRNETKLRRELEQYVRGESQTLEQLGAFSMRTRANPSQYFHRGGEMTWVDCTSRATFAAMYVAQNGYVDFDGKCRLVDGATVAEFVSRGLCTDLGVTDFFVSGENQVKREVFSQKADQKTVEQWVEDLGIEILPERRALFDRIKHVRTDPYKVFEADQLLRCAARGVNERLYGLGTFATLAGRTVDNSSVSRASYASNVSSASAASAASDASHASNVSSASDASRASNVSAASDANSRWHNIQPLPQNPTGDAWQLSPCAIQKPPGLEYPREFRAGIFALAGVWKIDHEIVRLARLGWFDPFSGHGKSPLYAKRHGIRYLGHDTNERAFREYLHVVNEVCAQEPGPDARVEQQDSTVFRPHLVGQFDLCYTSPPYFNFEEYGGNTAHFDGCRSYAEFHERVSRPVLKNVYQYLVPGGVLALQIEKKEKAKRAWMQVVSDCGFVISDARLTGVEKNKYSMLSKRDQNLIVALKPSEPACRSRR